MPIPGNFMPDGITIRTARPEDSRDILRLWKELMDYHAALDPLFAVPPEVPEKCHDWILENIHSERACVIVAEADSAIVGYSIAAITPYPPALALEQYGEVYDLAVTASYRRRGAGSALFSYVREWFSRNGIDRVEARVAVTNEVSTAFWHMMGLKQYMAILYCESQPLLN